MRLITKPRASAQNREVILAALKKARRPMGAYDLIEEIRGLVTLAPQSVYRALSGLIEDGLAHRLESMNAYVACTHGAHQGTPSFAVCESCGCVVEFDGRGVADTLRSCAGANGFSVRRTTLEVQGLCAACPQD